MKVVAVFPKGGDASKNDKYVNCEENALGLRSWAEKNKADLIVTSSKDGNDSGLTVSYLTVLSVALANLKTALQRWIATHALSRDAHKRDMHHACAWYLLKCTM